MGAYRAPTSLAATVNQLLMPDAWGFGKVPAAEQHGCTSWGWKGLGHVAEPRGWQRRPGSGFYSPLPLVLGPCVAACACLGKCLKPHGLGCGVWAPSAFGREPFTPAFVLFPPRLSHLFTSALRVSAPAAPEQSRLEAFVFVATWRRRTSLEGRSGSLHPRSLLPC